MSLSPGAHPADDQTGDDEYDDLLHAVRQALYPFDLSWAEADAALADDARADRDGVRAEHAWLNAKPGDRTEHDPYGDPVGVLGPVLARLHASTGRRDAVWCAGGWARLIAETDRRLADLDPSYALGQVKEKFGTLRYYAQPSGEAALDEQLQQQFRRVIHAAEAASAFLCEVCGRADGSLRGRPPRRVRTLCDTHAGWGVRP